MIRNYFHVALRNLRQNPLFSVINVLSLAIGLAASIAIHLFVTEEVSFDAFNTKRDRIFRVDEVQNFTGTIEQKVALTGGPFGPRLQRDFPEIEAYARFWGHGNVVLQKETKKILIDVAGAVDSTFLEIFDYELLEGDRSTALDEPTSIVLTEETARKFFPDVHRALNATITVNKDEYKITGILRDVPFNSHLQFQALLSITTWTRPDPKFNDEWGGNFLTTYLLLKPNASAEGLQAKLFDFMIRFTESKDINKSVSLFLQSLPQIHLGSTDIEHDYHNYRKFNGRYLDVFRIIIVLILLIAAVNFMNLTTARSFSRGKEIGVRKSIGAKRVQLLGQFIFESMLLAVIALFFAALIDLLFLPVLNQSIGRTLSLLTLLSKPSEIGVVILVTLALGMFAGLYPSFYITAGRLTHLLKGGVLAGKKSIFRSSLVVIQFGLALAMIVSTLIVLQQLYFMKNKDIGFNKDQIVLLSMNDEVNKKFQTLKTELLRNNLIKGVTASGQRIGNNFHQWGFKVKTDTGIAHFAPSNVNVEYDYLTVYGIQIKEGRNFSKEVPTDKYYAFIINESMVKALHLKDPIGTPVGHGHFKDDSLGAVIGVAKDFNFNSLHHRINTLSIVCHPEWGYDEMSVKIDGTHTAEAIAKIKALWDANITTYPFGYSFLDDHFEKLYRSDQQMSAVVAVMAALAILISCLGLFGMAAITMERKVKEIGIRKTLGATEGQLMVMLSRNFAWLVVISFVVASPMTYYILSGWLGQFAYRIDIDPVVFLLGGALAFLIAIGTVSYHTFRTARQNPVKALRTE